MARKPIGRPEELTVDYRNLLSLTFVDRINMARSAEGQSYLAALSPSQLEDLFPNYYKKYLPKNLTGAASGGIPFQGELPVPSWRLPGTEFQQRPEREKQRVAPSAVPAPSKSPEIKESWQDKIKKGLEGERQPSFENLKPIKELGNLTGNYSADRKARFSEELKDRNLVARLYNTAKSEVGSDPREQRLFLETVFNRAMFSNKSLSEVLKPSYGYGSSATNTSIQDKVFDSFQQGPLSGIMAGSNDTKSATENASNDYRRNNPLANNRMNRDRATGMWSGGAQDKGELLYNLGKNSKIPTSFGINAERYQNHIDSQSKGPLKSATEVLPPQGPGLGDKSLQPLVPGGVEPGKAAVEPQKIAPGEIPALPQSLQDNPEFMEFYKNLPAEDKAVFPKYLEKTKPEDILKDMERYKKEKETQTETATPYKTNLDKVLGDTVIETQQKATRNLYINPNLKDKIEEAVLSVYGPGYKAQVYSGGQPEKGTSSKRVGSTRHDLGKAADVYIEGPDGKRLSRDEQRRLVQYWAAKGYGGVGVGMARGGLHLDIHSADGRNAWGYSGQSNSWNYLTKEEQNAILQAKKEGFKIPVSREEFTQYSKRVAERSDLLTRKGMKSEEARKQARLQIRDEINKEIEQKQQQSIPKPIETATSIPTPSVDQTVPEGQVPQTGQTGSTTPTGLTKESPSPGPAIPKQKVEESPPSQQSDTPTTEPVPEYEAQSEEPPGKFGGGEIPMKANENGIVMKNTGEVVAQINVDQEKLKTNPENGKLEVMPLRRNDPAEIQQKREQNIQNESNYAKQTSQSMENPNEVNRPTMTQEPQQNPNLRAMAEYNAAGGIPYSPSHERAMLNATTFGNSINHYGHKSTTTNLV